MKITWYGHSYFKVSFDGGSVVFDPYADGSVPGWTLPQLSADAVLCSHRHDDHAGAGKVTLSGREPDCKVETVECFHDDEHGAKRGANTIHILTADGVRVAHLGDIGCIPDHNVLGALQKVDVLLLPVGGNYTIDGEQAAELVKLIQPRTTIPMHYKTPGLTVAVSGAEDFLSRMGEGVERVSGSEIEITPMMPKVVVFEKPMGQE